MKKIKSILLLFIILTFFVSSLHADQFDKAILAKATQVEALKLGFGDYVLAKKLTGQQKKIAAEHPVKKTLKGTYKFQDGELFVVVDSKTDRILGIYKEKKEAVRQEVKTMVGDLMMQFDEPTTMAHDKMIYWAYDKDGKVSEERLDQSKGSGGIDTLATVKFSSTEPIFREPSKKDEKAKEKEEEIKKADYYVMITSGPLSSLFLAKNK